MVDCAYVTDGWCIHDDRWVEALRALGHDPDVLSIGPHTSIDDVRVRLVQLGTVPVLAGPLNSVTRHLIGLGTRLVGLSWGFDLHDMQAAGDDLAWLTRLDGLIVDSTATRNIAIAARLDPSKITTLPWGIDRNLFTPHGPRTTAVDLGLAPGSRYVLSLRAHEPLYRVSEIVDAFGLIADRVPEAHLVIGHSGSLTDALRMQTAELALIERVHFIGTVAESELPSLLRGAACYVSASQVDGTSVTLLQAMACGTPVVVSATPGNLGWVTDGETGRTFPVGDIRALADALALTLAQPDEAARDRAAALVARDADWSANAVRLQTALFLRG